MSIARYIEIKGGEKRMQKRICDVCDEEIDPDLGFYTLMPRIKGMIVISNKELDICSVKCLVDLATKLDKRVVRETIVREDKTKTVKFLWGSKEVTLEDVEEVEGSLYLTSDAYAEYRI